MKLAIYAVTTQDDQEVLVCVLDPDQTDRAIEFKDHFLTNVPSAFQKNVLKALCITPWVIKDKPATLLRARQTMYHAGVDPALVVYVQLDKMEMKQLRRGDILLFPTTQVPLYILMGKGNSSIAEDKTLLIQNGFLTPEAVTEEASYSSGIRPTDTSLVVEE